MNELQRLMNEIANLGNQIRTAAMALANRAMDSNVSIDESARYATVVVPDDQLSLAIGKEGQNARLAAKLVGYKIDIKPESYQEEA